MLYQQIFKKLKIKNMVAGNVFKLKNYFNLLIN